MVAIRVSSPVKQKYLSSFVRIHLELQQVLKNVFRAQNVTIYSILSRK